MCDVHVKGQTFLIYKEPLQVNDKEKAWPAASWGGKEQWA